MCEVDLFSGKFCVGTPSSKNSIWLAATTNHKWGLISSRKLELKTKYGKPMSSTTIKKKKYHQCRNSSYDKKIINICSGFELCSKYLYMTFNYSYCLGLACKNLMK